MRASAAGHVRHSMLRATFALWLSMHCPARNGPPAVEQAACLLVPPFPAQAQMRASLATARATAPTLPQPPTLAAPGTVKTASPPCPSLAASARQPRASQQAACGAAARTLLRVAMTSLRHAAAARARAPVAAVPQLPSAAHQSSRARGCRVARCARCSKSSSRARAHSRLHARLRLAAVAAAARAVRAQWTRTLAMVRAPPGAPPPATSREHSLGQVGMGGCWPVWATEQ